uniref:Uncharacterized protein n=1 Tax=Anguilla anguilla TaxID=7936 RepID=A0A0E9RH99_ANGAN
MFPLKHCDFICYALDGTQAHSMEHGLVCLDGTSPNFSFSGHI